MTNNIENLLEALSKSKFRGSFHLNNKMKGYVKEKGLDKIESDAKDLIIKRIGDAYPKNDGKQTPMRQVHPVFIAQHATGCCCRGCLERIHKIPKGKVLSNEEVNYVVNILMTWIKREIKEDLNMENAKKLVVYYSYTGHTRMIAESIQKKLECDILELKPVVPYSTDYQTVVDEEQNNESTKKTPEIQNIEKDLNNYGEIIIGSPVWWYTIAPVVRTFLKENDLSGKTIKPFATNAGWLGQTFKEIERLCSNSKVERGMNIVFTEDYSENQLVTSPYEIDKWIEQL